MKMMKCSSQKKALKLAGDILSQPQFKDMRTPSKYKPLDRQALEDALKYLKETGHN